ncbi:SEC-C metal-binding domain-containing protein [Paenibacillus oryzisoli]|uniref:SEC-C metal-binding domain-containing protein n=1 Tax=Paenibacillus oryzisoli TaxID=1850517 RepID=UPI003D2ABC37
MSQLVKVGRNDPCPCGSGDKYKKCCLPTDEAGNVVRIGAQQTAQAQEVMAEPKHPASQAEYKSFLAYLQWTSPIYEIIAAKLPEHLLGRYTWKDISMIASLWNHYSTLSKPIINKQTVILATLEYTLSFLLEEAEITQTAVAARYGVSAGSVSKRFQEILGFLDQTMGDDEEDEERDDDDDDDNDEVFDLFDDDDLFLPDRGLISPAQPLIDKAWHSHSLKERKALAEQAIKLDPLHPDAYNVIAGDLKDFQAAADYYRKGIEAGRKRLGSAFFKKNKGYFWGLTETRPFMRSMYGCAELCLYVLQRPKEALSLLEEMLDLSPDDSMGARYLLTTAYMLTKQYQKGITFIEEYDEDSAQFNYNRIFMLYMLQGPKQELKRLLRQAKKQNPHVLPLLLGLKKMPKNPPETIGFGDESEAVEYFMYHHRLYTEHPEIVAWMANN